MPQRQRILDEIHAFLGVEGHAYAVEELNELRHVGEPCVNFPRRAFCATDILAGRMLDVRRQMSVCW